MFSMIGALSKNNCVGKDNALPWRIPSDLKLFKTMTKGQIVVMGWNTYLSLDKKPLPERRNIVIVDKTRKFIAGEHGFEYMTFEEIVYEEDRNIAQEYFIIGGPKTWELFQDYYDSAIITRVDTILDGDSFVDSSVFKKLKFMTDRKPHDSVDTSKDEYRYKIEHYVLK